MSKRKLELLTKIGDNSTPLKELFITKNGVCTGNNAKYLSKNKINQKYKSIYVAKDVAQYKIKKPINYVLYDKNLLHRPRDEGIFAQPKILTQMIRGLNTKYSLICALDETNILALNNLNIIRKKDENSNIKALLGFLNSKIINYFFKSSITDVNIKTVYIDIIPLKFNDKNALKNIELCVDDLIKNPEDKNIRERLDKILYNLYGLNKEDVSLIESEFK